MKNWSEISLGDLHKVAAECAALIKPGKPILVDAEMGSGKTTFAAKLVKVLGGEETQVSSPTFGIIQSYALPNGSNFHHVDLYRIEDDEEFLDLDMDSYISDKDYLYIEWPEMFRNYFDLQTSDLKIKKTGPTRTFELK